MRVANAVEVAGVREGEKFSERFSLSSALVKKNGRSFVKLFVDPWMFG